MPWQQAWKLERPSDSWWGKGEYLLRCHDIRIRMQPQEVSSARPDYINYTLVSLEKLFFFSINRQLSGCISVGARDFSPENISIWGTSVFGFAYAVTGKSPTPNKNFCSTISDLSRGLGISFRVERCAVRRAFDDKRGRVCLNAHRQEHADAFNSAPGQNGGASCRAAPTPPPAGNRQKPICHV